MDKEFSPNSGHAQVPGVCWLGLCEGGKGGAVQDRAVPAAAPLCRHIYPGSTCFWLEMSSHVSALLQGAMLLEQHNAALPVQLIPQQEHFTSRVAFSLKKHFQCSSPSKS